MQQIYRRKPMPKCNFNKIAKQLVTVKKIGSGYELIV